MIYTIPTKRGLGVEIWGSYIDIKQFHETIAKFWNFNEHNLPDVAFESRNKIISGFSYEIRKAFEGKRLKRKGWHFTETELEDEPQYFGVQISWVHILFSMAALKYNIQFYERNKFDLSQMLQIEYWLEKSMFSIDNTTAKELKLYIEYGINAANENIYQFMRNINAEYFSLGGGKKEFKKLPKLLSKSNFVTAEYKEHESNLKNEAVRLKCNVADLDIVDKDINYDIKW